MLDNKVLLENIKKLCDSKGIKITNLEKELGFGGGIISRWGNNADPSLSKIIDIADYFHVTLDEVVGRSRKTTDENYEFINLIIEQTKNGQLQWYSALSKEYYELSLNHPDDHNVIIVNFSDEPDWRRKRDDFATKCNNGYLIFNSNLVINNSAIEKSEFFFYIQIDDQSEPVYQKCSQEQLLELYKIIKVSIEGITPEMETNKFKQLMLSKNSENIKQLYDTLLQDENTKEYFTEKNVSDLKKLLAIIGTPSMWKTANLLQYLIEYSENNK